MVWPVCGRWLPMRILLALALLLPIAAPARAAQETLYSFTYYWPPAPGQPGVCPGPGKAGIYRTVVVRTSVEDGKPWTIYSFGVSYSVAGNNRAKINSFSDFLKEAIDPNKLPIEQKIVTIQGADSKKLSDQAVEFLKFIGSDIQNLDDFDAGIEVIIDFLCKNQSISAFGDGNKIYRTDRILSDTNKNAQNLDQEEEAAIKYFVCIGVPSCKDDFKFALPLMNQSSSTRFGHYETLSREFSSLLMRRGILPKATADQKADQTEIKMRLMIDKEIYEVRNDIYSMKSMIDEQKRKIVDLTQKISERNKGGSGVYIVALLLVGAFSFIVVIIIRNREGIRHKYTGRFSDRAGSSDSDCVINLNSEVVPNPFPIQPAAPDYNFTLLIENMQSQIDLLKDNLEKVATERNSMQIALNSIDRFQIDLERNLERIDRERQEDRAAINKCQNELKVKTSEFVALIRSQSGVPAPAPRQERRIVVQRRSSPSEAVPVAPNAEVDRPAASAPPPSSHPQPASAPGEEWKNALLRQWSADLTQLTGRPADPITLRELVSTGDSLLGFGEWLVKEYLPQREGMDFYRRIASWLESQTQGRLQLILPEVGSVRNPEFDEVGDYSAPVKGNMNKIVAVIRPGLIHEGSLEIKARIVIPN